MPSLRSLAVPDVQRTSLDVPGLGQITGLSYDGGECTQFLGIKYADIPGRFRRSTPAEEPWPGKAWDGSKLGPYCPQPPRDFYPIPSPPPRTWLNEPTVEELSCLNLNISVPRHDAAKGPLPVMVFFHGGAFTYSAGGSPIYDGRLMATASALDFNTPTIIISLNYRLGVYGFLGGTDLQAYAASVGEVGCGNYGVWDQVLALRWVQKHIVSFGGDPSRVCIFGQSAGSASVACHLNRGEPLFQNAIMQSGVMSLCGIMTPKEYQVVFEKILLAVGVSLDLGPIERVHALAKVPEKALTAAMVPVFGIPVITMALCNDGVLVPQMNRLANLRNFEVPSFVNRLMIGDALHECIIWNKAWAELPVMGLLERMRAFLGKKADVVAKLYGISTQLTPKETFDIIERMTTDGLYRLPDYLAAPKIPNSYVYHFQVPSAYENEWKGLCHHSFDNVLIWGNLKHTLGDEAQSVGDKMTSAWLNFAHGQEPWEAYEVKERICVFGPKDAEMKTLSEYDSRSKEIWEVLDRENLVAPLYALSEELCLQRESLLLPVS